MIDDRITTLSDDRIAVAPDRSSILSIRSLYLTLFRNYLSAAFELSAAPVVLTGRNGAGKTNILEALSLLTPGRGLRRARLSEIDHCGQLPWAISATVLGMQGEVKIGTGREPETAPLPPTPSGFGGRGPNPPPLRGRGDWAEFPLPEGGRVREGEKRLVKIDGKMAKSQAELGRHMAMIWLTPQMEQLFHEGASAGRKFLDRLVYSFDSGHASRVNEYEFAMRERNKLLATGQGDAHWLDALEQTMAETGAAIASARLLTCDHINAAIRYSPLSFPKAHIEIHGFIEDKLAAGDAAVAVEEIAKKTWRENRRLDGAAGRALVGAHRSEMQVIHVEKQMPAGSCSTGEQKALLLSIVLAQARAGAKWHGVVPVLLLDEVAAHLDATKRLELFGEIDHIKAQVWMTGTDVKLFEGLEGKAQYFQVENGTLF